MNKRPSFLGKRTKIEFSRGIGVANKSARAMISEQVALRNAVNLPRQKKDILPWGRFLINGYHQNIWHFVEKCYIFWRDDIKQSEREKLIHSYGELKDGDVSGLALISVVRFICDGKTMCLGALLCALLGSWDDGPVNSAGESIGMDARLCKPGTYGRRRAFFQYAMITPEKSHRTILPPNHRNRKIRRTINLDCAVRGFRKRMRDGDKRVETHLRRRWRRGRSEED
ncbi:hypothetical protein EDD18DRAFT_1113541 [Armillaria luteobubalina]|uniref:Uncharacterized protein n=1 Tax=Armillaria luteobubalina TaxID=153913 RepID=A0AA39PB84_9AGAR|nr:hypothetical protein EDD18DRAFT_1113541 [Armillaria luteobubalina]